MASVPWSQVMDCMDPSHAAGEDPVPFPRVYAGQVPYDAHAAVGHVMAASPSERVGGKEGENERERESRRAQVLSRPKLRTGTLSLCILLTRVICMVARRVQNRPHP